MTVVSFHLESYASVARMIEAHQGTSPTKMSKPVLQKLKKATEVAGDIVERFPNGFRTIQRDVEQSRGEAEIGVLLSEYWAQQIENRDYRPFEKLAKKIDETTKQTESIRLAACEVEGSAECTKAALLAAWMIAKNKSENESVIISEDNGYGHDHAFVKYDKSIIINPMFEGSSCLEEHTTIPTHEEQNHIVNLPQEYSQELGNRLFNEHEMMVSKMRSAKKNNKRLNELLDEEKLRIQPFVDVLFKDGDTSQPLKEPLRPEILKQIPHNLSPSFRAKGRAANSALTPQVKQNIVGQTLRDLGVEEKMLEPFAQYVLLVEIDKLLSHEWDKYVW